MSVREIAATRYRLDDLRRFAASLATSLGVAAPRASALASHLLWFDAAGASSHGITTLPTWLARIENREVDPIAEGRSWFEHAGTAIFDAQNGIGPLVLARAAGIASEKARDLGVGMVRVQNIGPFGPPAPVAADLAIGPIVATITGPGASLTLAIPMPEGLPAVYDSSLAIANGEEEPTSFSARGGPGPWSPWASALAGGDGWAILALAVTALEPLTSFHESVAISFRGVTEGPGQLLPVPWEGRRRETRERGVALEETALVGLREWSDRLGIPWPSTFGG